MCCSIVIPQTVVVFGGNQDTPKSELGRDCFDFGGETGCFGENQFNGEMLFVEIGGCRAAQSYLLALALRAGGFWEG